jgi:hypothetical protein
MLPESSVSKHWAKAFTLTLRVPQGDTALNNILASSRCLRVGLCRLFFPVVSSYYLTPAHWRIPCFSIHHFGNSNFIMVVAAVIF